MSRTTNVALIHVPGAGYKLDVPLARGERNPNMREHKRCAKGANPAFTIFKRKRARKRARRTSR